MWKRKRTDQREVVLLEAEPERGPLQRALWRALQRTVPELPTSGIAANWSHFVALAHQSGFRGARTRLAVIDTGCNLFHRTLQDRIVGYFNFTTEPQHDIAGHGTVVTLLLHQVAPEADIIVIKAIGADRRSDTEVLARALEQAAEEGAQIINISAGIHRWKVSGAQEGKDWELLDLAGVCNCELCRTAEQIAGSTGAAIFASAGNMDYRDGNYHWWCPAMAADVVPVVGMDGDQPIARLPFAVTGADGPGVVSRVNYRRQSEPLGILAQLLPRPASWRGSSFAAPIVAGTAALVAQMFPPDLAPKRFFVRNIRDAQHPWTDDAIASVQWLFIGSDNQQYEFVPTPVPLILNLARLAENAHEQRDHGRAIALWQVEFGLAERLWGPESERLVAILLNMAQTDLNRDEVRQAATPAERMLWIKCAPMALSRATAIRDRLKPQQLPADVARELASLERYIQTEYSDRMGYPYWPSTQDPRGPLPPLDWSRAGLPVYLNAL